MVPGPASARTEPLSWKAEDMEGFPAVLHESDPRITDQQRSREATRALAAPGHRLVTRAMTGPDLRAVSERHRSGPAARARRGPGTSLKAPRSGEIQSPQPRPLPPKGSDAQDASKLGIAGTAHAHPSGSVWPPPAVAQEQCATYH